MKKLALIILLSVIFVGGMILEDVIFFSDSPDGDKLYDSSWGYRKSPSWLELAGSNDKFPVDTKHPYQGAHSLRLHWISKTGGDWGLAVASPGWRPHDFTQYDSIVYWINGPAAIAQADLPDLLIEDLSNKKSDRVWLGDHFTGVDDDSTSWQKVMIPISAFTPGTQNCDLKKIKTIFHFQKAADEVEHIAWIDEIRLIEAGGVGPLPPTIPQHIVASGHDSRIDLRWDYDANPDLIGYFIYRADAAGGPFTKINLSAHNNFLYSDFIGTNGNTYYYYVTAANKDYLESEPSDTVFASTYEMTDEELLTSVQEATFRYFYDYGHPVSGLTREISGSGDVCTSGGTGFGLMTIVVGAERGFVSRDSAAARILKMLTFLEDKAERFHGAWSHWLNGTTGETIPFSTFDNGGDIVETAYLVQGLLTIRQYFTLDNAVENEIRTRATRMWESVEWDWYRRDGGLVLFWHWSPNYGWQMNFALRGYNEAMITYLLAIASPTHGVPATLFHQGWAGTSYYLNGKSFYGYKIFVGWDYGGPLFFTHYSFLGFDPRDKSDDYCNYFDNSRNISLIHRAYCIQNPYNHAGYDSLSWGLTASYNPWGYAAHEPVNRDNGTITPTAAISAMPYTPEESLATLNHFYRVYGPQLWGEFGFRDAFNLDQNWFAQIYVAIDQGTIVPMIENYRTGLCWDLFMSNPEIQPMLDAIGFKPVSVNDNSNTTPAQFQLFPNYPNPFNNSTMISYQLSAMSPVKITIYDILGKTVKILVNQKQDRGFHKIHFDASELQSGVYICQLIADKFVQTKKMVLLQ